MPSPDHISILLLRLGEGGVQTTEFDTALGPEAILLSGRRARRITLWTAALPAAALAVGLLCLGGIVACLVQMAEVRSRLDALERRPQISAEEILEIQRAERAKVSAEERTIEFLRSKKER